MPGVLRRQLIFIPAGPALGWIGLCLAAAISNGPQYVQLVVFGVVVFPLIFAIGALPAAFTFWLDGTLLERSWSRPLRSMACGAVGGLLSVVLLHFAPVPLPGTSSLGLLNALPGCLAGLICSYWAGADKGARDTRGIGAATKE